MSRTLPRRDFVKNTRVIKLGQVMQPDDLVRDWVQNGYQAVNTVVTAGQFARRGGILDIWPANAPQPTRLEFFGDEIDTLRIFNPSTQRTTGARNDTDPTGARVSGERRPRPRSPGGGRNLRIPHPPAASQPCQHPGLPAPDALVVIDNDSAFHETVNEIEEQSVSLRREYIEDGSIPADFPIPYLTWDQIQDSLPPNRTLILGPVTDLARRRKDTRCSLGRSVQPQPAFWWPVQIRAGTPIPGGCQRRPNRDRLTPDPAPGGVVGRNL